ncbi:MAG: twin transmembrane helix small protein [Gammaproteobacteria bacterium]|nr:twin transmembrane helix small protein [Gammaproteobacteria bacterium]MDH3432734.1 twin transmembrane helix small protein [Gammaproteobacteria bacterium]
MKVIVLVLLAAIVIALFSGLFFLVKDKDHPNSPRLLTALKVRVGLSIALVLLLVLSYQFGWLSG